MSLLLANSLGAAAVCNNQGRNFQKVNAFTKHWRISWTHI